MKQTAAKLWQHNRVALIAFVLAGVLTLFFLGRFVLFTVYWADPSHRDQPIAGWMTPGYVAHSYHVPKPVVFEALGLTQQEPDHRSLERLADELGTSVPELADKLMTAIEAERQRQQ